MDVSFENFAFKSNRVILQCLKKWKDKKKPLDTSFKFFASKGKLLIKFSFKNEKKINILNQSGSYQ